MNLCGLHELAMRWRENGPTFVRRMTNVPRGGAVTTGASGSDGTHHQVDFPPVSANDPKCPTDDGLTVSRIPIIFRNFLSPTFPTALNLHPISKRRSHLPSLFTRHHGEEHARSIDQVAPARPPDRTRCPGPPTGATHTDRSPDRSLEALTA